MSAPLNPLLSPPFDPPSAPTPALIAAIAAKIRVGSPRKTAAAAVGLKDQHLRQWLLKGEQHLAQGLTEVFSPFADLYTQCRLAALQHEQEMAEAWARYALTPRVKRTYKHLPILDPTTGLPVIGPDGAPLTVKTLDREIEEGIDWQCGAEYMARRYPERWGKGNRVELTGAKGGPIETKNESQLRIEQASYPVANLPEEVKRELLKQLLGEGVDKE